MKKSLFTFLLFCLLTANAFSQTTINSIGYGQGNWNDPSMWDLNRVPNANDVVGISKKRVTINTTNAVAKQVILESGIILDTELNIVNGGKLTVTETFTAVNKSEGSVELNLSGNGQLFVEDLKFDRTLDFNVYHLALNASENSFIHVSNDFTWELGKSLIELVVELELTENAHLEVNNNTTFNMTGGYNLGVVLSDSSKFTTLGQLNIIKSGGNNFIIQLEDHSSFEADGLDFNQSGGTGASYFKTLGGTFKINDVSTITNTQTNSFVKFLVNGTSSILDFRKDITLTANSENDIQFNIENKSKFHFGGNFTRNNGFGDLNMASNTTLVFDGSSAQTVPTEAGSGTDSFTFGMIQFANTSSQPIELNEDLIIDTQIELMGGVITSEVGKMVVFGENAIVTGGSEDNYISGPVKKIGLGANQEFTFPSGHLGKYAPMTIYSTVKAAGEFTARFINCPPPYGNVDPTQTPMPLDHVSELERWTLERSAGSDDVDIRLHWSDATAAGISDTTSLVIAMYDGTNWVNIGRSEPMGSAAAGQAGSIKNAINCPPPYGMTEFTFGSTTQQQNLLPVVMTSFGGSQNGNAINLNWVTSQEINTDIFVVESSTDGSNFSRISEVEAQGNSTLKHSYFSSDNNPVVGTNYYRLRQMDLNGMFTISNVIGIEFKESIQIDIYPNPVAEFINLKGNFADADDNLIQVYDQTARLVYKGQFSSSGGLIEIQTEKLGIKNSGMYYLQLNIGNKQQSMQMYISK